MLWGPKCSGSDFGRQRQAISAFCLIFPMGEKLKKKKKPHKTQDRRGLVIRTSTHKIFCGGDTNIQSIINEYVKNARVCFFF